MSVLASAGPQLPDASGPRPRVAKAVAGLAWLAAVAMAVTGCGGQAAVRLPPKVSAPDSPAAFRSGTPGPSPRRRVVDAYAGYWRAMGRALDARNARRAAAILARYAVPGTLPALVRTLRSDWARDEVSYGSPVLHVHSVRIRGDHAAVHDCADFSHAGLQDARTGRAFGFGGARVNMITILVLRHGRWLVSNQIPVVMSCKP